MLSLPRITRIARMKTPHNELLHGDVTDAILRAFFSVYNELGYGFLEIVYRNALVVALAELGLATRTEVPFVVTFRNSIVGEYRADLLVEDKVVVETKAIQHILAIHEAQLLNYLRATGMRVGLILNFGRHAQFRRMILTPQTPQEKSAQSAQIRG